MPLVAVCCSSDSISSRSRAWSCSCASPRRFSRSRTLAPSSLGDLRATGGLASLDFLGFGPRRISLSWPPYESAGDRLRRRGLPGQAEPESELSATDRRDEELQHPAVRRRTANSSLGMADAAAFRSASCPSTH